MARPARQGALDLEGVKPQRMAARVRTGVDATIRELRQREVITGAHSAQVALARSLADMLDREMIAVDPSAYNVAQLSGKLQTALDRLTHTAGEQTDTTMADFLASINTPSP